MMSGLRASPKLVSRVKTTNEQDYNKIIPGTTWTLELVYAIMNDLDYAKSSSKTQEERIPFIE